MASAIGPGGRAAFGATCAVLALMASGGPGGAQETTALRGELFVAGRHLVDPPPADSKTSHAYMTIKGAAAMRLFRNLPGKEEWDYCLGGQWMRKRAGNLSCSILRAKREAVCDFSVDLRDGTLTDGKPC